MSLVNRGLSWRSVSPADEPPTVRSVVRSDVSELKAVRILSADSPSFWNEPRGSFSAIPCSTWYDWSGGPNATVPCRGV